MTRSTVFTRRDMLRYAATASVATAGTMLDLGRASAASTLENIKKQQVLRIGFFQAPPISFVEASGKYSGYSVELAKRIAEENGIGRVEATVLEFEGLIPALTGGRFDMITCDMQIKPERCRVVAFSRPTSLITTGLATRPGNPLKLKSFEDIAANSNVRLGGVAATHQLTLAKRAGVKESQISEFPNDDAMVNGLLAGRVDCISSVVPILLGLVAKKPGADFQVVSDFRGPMVDGKPVINGCGFTFRKADSDLVEFFNVNIRKQLESGWQRDNLKRFGLGDDGFPALEMTADQFCNVPA